MNEYTIKLNQETENEAYEFISELLEKGNKGVMAFNYLVGQIEDSGDFIFSSRARGAGLSEYKGQLVTKEDGVYLTGIIQPRKSRIKLLYGLIIFNMLFGILLLFSKNPLFMIVSIPFMIVPWFNLAVAKKGNYLKVSLKKIFKL